MCLYMCKHVHRKKQGERETKRLLYVPGTILSSENVQINQLLLSRNPPSGKGDRGMSEQLLNCWFHIRLSII